MVSAELLLTLKNLNRLDKFQIMKILISELAEQEINLIRSDQDYPIWSPYDAVEAADTMLKVLKTTKNQDHA